MDPGSGAEEAGVGTRKLERTAGGSHSRRPFLSRFAPLTDEDHVDEARLLRALDHGRQIRPIIREIKMGVRVDEHRQPGIPPFFGSSAGYGLSPPRLATLRTRSSSDRWFAATSARSSRQSEPSSPSSRESAVSASRAGAVPSSASPSAASIR